MTKISTRTDEYGILEVKCKSCGKTIFIRPAQYAYVRYTDPKRKVGRKFFCKYTCMTAYNKEQAEKKEKRKKKRTSE